MKGLSALFELFSKFLKKLQGADRKQGAQNVGFNLLMNWILNTHSLQSYQLQIGMEE